MVAIIVVVLNYGCAPQKSTSQLSQEQPQVIKLERFRKALWKVHVTVQGKSGNFLLDTGGGITMLSEDFSRDMECTFWGRTTGYNMFGTRGDGAHCDSIKIKASNAILAPANVGKIDFGDRFSGDITPDGLLSLDAFDGKAITINPTSGTLTIETSESLASRTNDMIEFPMRVSRECSGRCFSVFIGVNTKNGMTWLLLDSGAGGVSLISKEYAQVFGLDPNLEEQQLKYDLANELTIDSPVVVTDMIMDGNLGQPFLSKYIITMDLLNSRLWLKN
ncbi:hypothetical protein LX77_03222 [Gelidibacter algens]|uniref:Aspartyl protease n=2 Tax=Gelidibacter algens TaxID=49280 RepID=A0A327RV19_9FLAO|nr:hypothetical protein LX77_03222 [Gelidibacter algens]